METDDIIIFTILWNLSVQKSAKDKTDLYKCCKLKFSKLSNKKYRCGEMGLEMRQEDVYVIEPFFLAIEMRPILRWIGKEN